MYYLKKTASKGVNRASVTINDFSNGSDFSHDSRVTPFYKSNVSYNFECESGALKDASGIKIASFGELNNRLQLKVINAEKLYYFKSYNQDLKKYEDRLLVYVNRKIYMANPYLDSDFSEVLGLEFNGAPTAVRYAYNGKNVIIFTFDNQMKVFDGEKVIEVSDVPCITSTCIHNERLFATEGGEKTTLWFSDDFDPLNWKISLHDAGFIDFRDDGGSLIKVVSFNGYVYLFRNYGITRITAYGDQTEFATENIATSSGKIYGESITVCGNRIIYLAEDGFYSFSGGSTNRILKGLDECLKSVENENAKGVYYNGKFYCNLKLKIENAVQNCLIYYDLTSKNFTVCKNLKFSDFQIMDGENDFKLLFLNADNGAIGELSSKSECFGLPILKRWVSAKYDFLNSNEKVVTSVSLVTKTDINLSVESEAGKRKIKFLASDKIQTKSIGIKGNAFTFTIDCIAPASNISRFKVNYEFLTE